MAGEAAKGPQRFSSNDTMISRRSTSIVPRRLALVLCLAAVRLAAAQDPFGEAKPKADAAAPAAKAVLPLISAVPDPLAIRLLRASNPTTPNELLQAAQVTRQYGRLAECKAYLAALLAAKAGDEALAPLASRFG